MKWLVLLGMARGTGAAGECLLLFRTSLGNPSMAAEAGIGHMAPAVNFAVMHNLEIAAFRLLVFRIMATGSTALELGRRSGHLVMADGALILRIDSQRGEVGGHAGMAGRAVLGSMDIMIEIDGLLGQIHLDGPGRDMCELRGAGRQSQSGDYQSGGAERQQLFHRVTSSWSLHETKAHAQRHKQNYVTSKTEIMSREVA